MMTPEQRAAEVVTIQYFGDGKAVVSVSSSIFSQPLPVVDAENLYGRILNHIARCISAAVEAAAEEVEIDVFGD